MPIQKSRAEVLKAKTRLQSKSSLWGWALECHKHMIHTWREGSPPCQILQIVLGFGPGWKHRWIPPPSSLISGSLWAFAALGFANRHFASGCSVPPRPCTSVLSSHCVWPLRDVLQGSRAAQTSPNPATEEPEHSIYLLGLLGNLLEQVPLESWGSGELSPAPS